MDDLADAIFGRQTTDCLVALSSAIVAVIKQRPPAERQKLADVAAGCILQSMTDDSKVTHFGGRA